MAKGPHSERIGIQRHEKDPSRAKKNDPGELRNEANAIKTAIVKYSQRLKSLNVGEQQQMNVLASRLEKIRSLLGEKLSPSEERICLPAQAVEIPPKGIPTELADGFSSQVAMRIERVEE